ncbi:MAG: hypothetical protein JSV24_04780 [Bacteroidales bacterium]|nr:MAG: hypothetical protein JSV24_04780 [Bacteroidales bacterium]
MNLRQKRYLIFLFLVFYPFIFSGKTPSRREPARLFESNEILTLELIADMDSLIQDIGDDPAIRPATLCYFDDTGNRISVPIQVYTRGNFRRRPENCNFPPLEFKFSKKDVENTIFEGQDELKLVTHCQTDLPEYTQFLFKEYLVYRLYNEFSSFSFRVRLFEITYIDKDDPDDRISSYGFFIERPKHMAGRNGGVVLKVENFSISDMDSEIFAQLALFQYMIANNDWSIPILHNIKLVSYDPLRPPVPVPYDFDYAGIINAPYRSMIKDSSQDNESDRFYKGICWSRREFISLFEIFKRKKHGIFKLYQEFELMDVDEKAQTVQILNDFYELIDRPGSAVQELRKDCKSWQ